MKILVACEESQIVTKELRELGHEAYSCDIMSTSGNNPEWHIKDDVLKHLEGWDMILAFPPCTHLAVSGARHFKAKRESGVQQEAIEFFMNIVNAPCDKIMIENPIGIMSTHYRKPDQIIQPYHFGDSARKSTCIWLKGLPKLTHTNVVEPEKQIVFKSGKRMGEFMAKSYGNSKLRSKTFPGIAKAIATQLTVNESKEV